jgi:hypothetical protein
MNRATNKTTYPKGRQYTGNNAFMIERFNETKVSKKNILYTFAE